jgi:tyrosine-protein kinase Etk/Wzc
MSLVQSKADLEIARAGTVINFVILAPANTPVLPIHPTKKLIYGIGAAASIILCIIFLLVRYILSDEITGLAELERLVKLPVLGIVPNYKYEKKNGHSQMVIHHQPKSIVAESLRTIRTNMDFMKVGDSNKIISITSTISGEGKTFVSVNLAAIFALSQYKVIVLDLDLRKAKVHVAFNDEKADKGMSTILIGRDTPEDCIRKTELGNLDYIPVGPLPPNPSELLLNPEFDRLIEYLKSKYDFIIMDTPPIGLVTDGVLVMQKADLPIYIVRAGYSKRAFAKTIMKVNQMNRVVKLSLILNGTNTGNRYGYGHGYGYGYGYGQGYYEEQPKAGFFTKLFKKNA